DRNVTGVQTCALPIFLMTEVFIIIIKRFSFLNRKEGFHMTFIDKQFIQQKLRNLYEQYDIGTEKQIDQSQKFMDAISDLIELCRSEERRVGKGWSSEW